MDKNELWKLYCQKDKEFETAKGKRMIITILLFAAGYFAIIYALEEPTNWKDIVGTLVLSIIISGIHVLINAAVFGHLALKGREEAETLERIKKRIEEK